MYEEQLEFKVKDKTEIDQILFQDLLLVIRSTSHANYIAVVGCHRAGSSHNPKL